MNAPLRHDTLTSPRKMGTPAALQLITTWRRAVHIVGAKSPYTSQGACAAGRLNSPSPTHGRQLGKTRSSEPLQGGRPCSACVCVYTLGQLEHEGSASHRSRVSKREARPARRRSHASGSSATRSASAHIIGGAAAVAAQEARPRLRDRQLTAFG